MTFLKLKLDSQPLTLSILISPDLSPLLDRPVQYSRRLYYKKQQLPEGRTSQFNSEESNSIEENYVEIISNVRN